MGSTAFPWVCTWVWGPPTEISRPPSNICTRIYRITGAKMQFYPDWIFLYWIKKVQVKPSFKGYFCWIFPVFQGFSSEFSALVKVQTLRYHIIFLYLLLSTIEAKEFSSNCLLIFVRCTMTWLVVVDLAQISSLFDRSSTKDMRIAMHDLSYN